MILVPIIAVMRKVEIRSKFRLHLLKPVLNRDPLTREVTFAKRSDDHLFSRQSNQEIIGTAAGLFRPRPRGTEHHPLDFQVRNLVAELEQSSPCANFDIVRVSAKTKNALH